MAAVFIALFILDFIYISELKTGVKPECCMVIEKKSGTGHFYFPSTGNIDHLIIAGIISQP
jgi:hypothetical protein